MAVKAASRAVSAGRLGVNLGVDPALIEAGRRSDAADLRVDGGAVQRLGVGARHVVFSVAKMCPGIGRDRDNGNLDGFPFDGGADAAGAFALFPPLGHAIADGQAPQGALGNVGQDRARSIGAAQLDADP